MDSLNRTSSSKNFYLLLIGQVISLFGNSIQRYSMSLFILDITGSASTFSVIIAISIIPTILLSPIGGAIADRFNRKHLMVGLDLISTLLTGSFAIALLLGHSSITIIGVLMVLLSILAAIEQPATQACIPIIVEDGSLEKANGLVSQVSSISNLFGPILAGTLYGVCGLNTVIFINCASFFFAAIIEMFLYIPYVSKKIQKNLVVTLFGDMKDSLQYVIHKKAFIMQLILMFAALNLFVEPVYSIGVPYIIKKVLNAGNQLYGVTESVICFGGLLGALLIGITAKKFSVTNLYKVFYLSGASFILMSASIFTPFLKGAAPLLAYCLFTLLAFFSMYTISTINIISVTFLQKQISNEIMGKVMDLVTAICMCCMPIGQVFYGVLIELFAHNTYIITTLAATFTLIVALVIKRILKDKF